MIQITTVVGYVLKMGDLCYKDEKDFHQEHGVKKNNG
jgi:hypothetical protein